MPFDFQRARALLQDCELPKLFIEELGWEPCHQKLILTVGDKDYSLFALAEKRNFIAWLCELASGDLQSRETRLKLDRKLSETSYEHLIVFVTGDRSHQSWMWVRREQGKPLAARNHEYERGQEGDSLLQKLQFLYVSLEEEEAGLSTVVVAGRARAAFDVEIVTKSFYKDFDAQRKAFLKFIEGISEAADNEWYASVMLNRLMFVYFIQRKGFLDGNHNYLRNRLDRCKRENGKDRFYSFYRYFLLRLFHEGFGKRREDRAPDLEKLLGIIPYLNGGLFDVHELERPERYGKDIQIPDKAFERIFDFFDQWQWHLDERPLRKGDEINPDVLGYIFEKYINQKQLGAYYSKEDITEYISKNTVLPFLLDESRAKCKVAFENSNGPTVWDLLRENPDRYIYPAVRHGLSWNYIPNHKAKGTPLHKAFDLPPEIAAGLDVTAPNLIERRKEWNKAAPAIFALPTETWREVVARRQRYEEIKHKLSSGEIREVNDFVTHNLDLGLFAQDIITNIEGPDLLRAFWNAIEKVTILDPTCGSGAFLFAALNILEPLYESCLDRMEAFIADEHRLRSMSPEETILGLIELGESRTLEFKSAARWNVKEGKADKVMEQVIGKTIAAFLNSSGGDLLIGVQDDGTIFGIEADLQLFSAEKRSRDMYENWLMTQLLGVFGKEHATNLRVSFARLSGHDVCRVSVLPTSNAVYIKENNQEALYVRTGNSTRSLSTKEAIAYHQQRFTQNAPQRIAAEPQKPRNPKKYAKFREVLEMVAAHPNRRYFILKSIILNNLFGVDIMEEAVEICKLRLFLKLAAQVVPDVTRENLGIEPLPDIDFNIRAGNTLIGYATYDEVKQAVERKLDFDDATEKISVKAADLQQTFDKFRQLQRESDGSVPAVHKQELQKRLQVLEEELNRYLAFQYGIKSDKANAAYINWVKSHQPFHWFIQFYGILRSGGFSVIIGNPPYVEYNKLENIYRLPRGQILTEECGNLLAFVTERSLKLLATSGRSGLVLLVSTFTTERMRSLQQLILSECSCSWVSNFAWRPAKLFAGCNTINAIFLSVKGKVGSNNARTYSTKYLKWTSEERDCLFPLLVYGNSTPFRIAGSFPKVASKLDGLILEKLFLQGQSLLYLFSGTDPRNSLFYFRGMLYWIKVLDHLPIHKEEGKSKISSQCKHVLIDSQIPAHSMIAIMSSSLFFWFYQTFSDCQQINRREFIGFKFQPTKETLVKLDRLGKQLMKDYKRNSKVIERHIHSRGVNVQKEYFEISRSKSIIDEIDMVMAGHYKFNAEELDFILNYDIKYRMGRDTESEES